MNDAAFVAEETFLVTTEPIVVDGKTIERVVINTGSSGQLAGPNDAVRIAKRGKITWSCDVGDAAVFVHYGEDINSDEIPTSGKKRRSPFSKLSFVLEKNQDVVTPVRVFASMKRFKFSVVVIKDNDEGTSPPILDPRIIIN